MLVLPHGLYYGRLDPVTAIAVAGAHLAGELDLDHLRGRASWPDAGAGRRDPPAPRARRHPHPDVRLAGRRVDGDVTTATFAVAGGT